MPVDVRNANHPLIEELDDLTDVDSRDKEVSFFLPTSRRQSEEDTTNSASRPRAFAINQDGTSEFSLFHTFQLTSQTGPSQVAILPETALSGNRILAACRDDSLRCMYYNVHQELHRKNQVIVAPRSVSMSSIPVEKPWKIGALSCLPHDAACEGSLDVIAFLTYCQSVGKISKDSDADRGAAPRPILTVAWMEPGDLNLDKPMLANVELPFEPHGCNQLNWWLESDGSKRDTVILVMPSQEGRVYCSRIKRTLHDERDLRIENAASYVPVFARTDPSSTLNAFEYYDSAIHGERFIASSFGPRSSVSLGRTDSGESAEDFRAIWKVQHDSLTSRMKFFVSDAEKETVNLLVVGLLELVVVYRNVTNGSFPVATVLPRSLDYDIVTCCDVTVTRTGKIPEVILGTYNKVVLIYGVDESSAVLLRILEAPCPVHFVAVVDMILSDKKQLVVITQKGVQVYSLA